MKENRKTYTPLELCIWIDSYDDLFSDFDSRPFIGRNISDDFLLELKKQITEAALPPDELIFLISGSNRNNEIETTIVIRLHTFFQKKKQQLIQSKKKGQLKDFLYLIFGSGLMLCAALISVKKSDQLWMNGLLVITEPTGWFLVWSALDNLINTYKKKNTEIEFYTLLSKIKIKFSDKI